MTANTARNAAAADGTRQAARTGGTSVSLQGLSRSFGTTRALDGLSLEIAPGELVALLGPSGCGKTTALRIVAGFESADTGSVIVDGKDISPIPAAKRDMGMVFQSYSLFPNMNALDNVAFGLRMRKQGSAQRRKRAGELLDMVGLVEQAQQYPHQLSGGQQQRVALARALAIEPRVLLLDEPLSALDAKVRLQLREQIRTLQQRLGTTTLFVTHDQEEALSMADRVGVMRQGRLEQIAAPDVLYDDPATAFVAEFVGVMNRIPAELQASGNPRTVAVLGSIVPVKDQEQAEIRSAADGDGPVDVLVRPEGLTMQVVENGNGIVTHRTFLGSVTRVRVLLSGDVAVQIDKPSTEAAALAPGTSVSVSLPPEPVLVASPPARLTRGVGQEAGDRVQDERGAGLLQVLAGAGAGQHACHDPGPGPQPGLDVAGGVAGHRELADRPAAQAQQRGQRQVGPRAAAAGVGGGQGQVDQPAPAELGDDGVPGRGGEAGGQAHPDAGVAAGLETSVAPGTAATARADGRRVVALERRVGLLRRAARRRGSAGTPRSWTGPWSTARPSWPGCTPPGAGSASVMAAENASSTVPSSSTVVPAMSRQATVIGS